MREHPVPHNVLDIEFKLFGNFSVRQFLRILGGCALALFIYILKLPAIVSIPLIAMSIGFGIAAAMGDNFDARANTLLSSIIIPPRYIWRKTKVQPEFLVRDYQAKTLALGEAKATDKTKVNIHDLEIDQLIQARAAHKQSPNTPAGQERIADAKSIGIKAEGGSSFDMAYNKVFADTKPPLAPQANIAIGPGQQVQVNVVKSTATRPLVSTPQSNQLDITRLDISQLKERLGGLQGQLTMLQKQQAGQAEIDKINNEINDVYSRIKALAMQNVEPQARNTSLQSLVQSSENYLYGIVVDKSDRPLGNINIKITQRNGSATQQMQSQTDGRFQSAQPLPYGDYIVELTGQGWKFDKYNIVIGDKRLPAYKFRAH